MKVPIKFTIVLEYETHREDPYGADEEDVRYHLERSHCTGNIIKRLAASERAEDPYCNTCRFSTVEVLPQGTDAYKLVEAPDEDDD